MLGGGGYPWSVMTVAEPEYRPTDSMFALGRKYEEMFEVSRVKWEERHPKKQGRW